MFPPLKQRGSFWNDNYLEIFTFKKCFIILYNYIYICYENISENISEHLCENISANISACFSNRYVFNGLCRKGNEALTVTVYNLCMINRL